MSKVFAHSRKACAFADPQYWHSIDEDYKPDPTDAYALAKQEAETQAAAFVRWFPGMRVASLRIHQVEPLKDVRDEHEREPKSGITQLWGWVSPHETAKACLLACTTDKFEGHEGEG